MSELKSNPIINALERNEGAVQMKILKVEKAINSLLIEDLAKTLWDLTYLCWNITNVDYQLEVVSP